MTSPRLRIVLCADDYGLNEGTSRAILELADAGRISATSCMTNAPGWPGAARALQALDGRIGFGLHLTLTWGAPLGPMPRLAPGGRMPALGDLLRASLSGRVESDEVEAEIRRQWSRFADHVGRPPDFVDGHQHAHVLPGIRGPLLRVLAEVAPAGLWLRDPSDRVAAILRRRSAGKALTTRALAAGFGRAVRRSGFRTNRGFSGFSGFAPDGDADRDMRDVLVALGPAPLVMCHPGHADRSRPDEIEPARIREAAYLASPAFAGLLAERQARLVPAP